MIPKICKIFFNLYSAFICFLVLIFVMPFVWLAYVSVSSASDDLSSKFDEQPIAYIFSEMGQMIGTWVVIYPEVLYTSGDQPLTVAYRPDMRGWSGFITPSKLAISIYSSKLVIKPDPLSFKLDTKALRSFRSKSFGESTHESEKAWAVSAPTGAKEGEQYTLIFNSEVEPAFFRSIPFDFNGSELPTTPVTKPVTIKIKPVAIYWKKFSNFGQSILAGLAFVLALPWVTEIVKFALARLDKKQDKSDVDVSKPSPQS